MNEGVEPFFCILTQQKPQGNGNIILCDNPCPLSVIHIVMNVGNFVAEPYDLSLQGMRRTAGSVIQDPVPHLPGKIKSRAVFLQALHHPDTLPVMGKSKGTYPVKCPLPRMSKGRMAQIMSKGNGLHQVIIQPQSLCNGSGCLGDLQGVGQTVPVMIPLRCQEHLCLILQPPK